MKTICGQYLFLLLLTMLWQPIRLVGCYLPPTVLPECHCKDGLEGLTIFCTQLNSTRYLSHLHVDTAQAVVRVDISNSFVLCVDLQDLSRFHKLKHLKVTNSSMRSLICPPRFTRFKSFPNNLKGVRTLDVSQNQLSYLDSSIETSSLLEVINLSHNSFRKVSPVLTTFANLKSLDISNNHISDDLDKEIFDKITQGLQYLNLKGRCIIVS